MLSNLKVACNIAIKWFEDNLMQANPDKFQFMVLSPYKNEARDSYSLNIADVQLLSVTQATLLGILFDNELSFNAHVRALCKKCNFQLLTLKRLSKLMDASTKLTIFKSFIASNFTYCCHIWYFCSITLKTRLEKLQFRGLRYVYNDYDSSCEDLLDKAGMCTIDLLVQKTMLVEIFKCVHGIGAEYLANLFSVNKNSTRSDGINLTVPRVDSTTYGLHSIRYHGTKLWASLPSHVKSASDLATFKAGLVGFQGIKCKCNLCKSSKSSHF